MINLNGSTVATLTAAGIFGLVVAAVSLPWTQPTHKIYSDPGGNVIEYLAKYTEIAENNDRLEILGPCFSACTFFENIVPLENVCADYDRGLLYVHGVYAPGLFGTGEYDQAWTNGTFDMVYSDRMQEVISQDWDWTQGDVSMEDHPLGYVVIHPWEIGIEECR